MEHEEATLPALSHFGNRIDGVIGLDLLRMCESMRVDYRERILSLTVAPEAIGIAVLQADWVELDVTGQTLRWQPISSVSTTQWLPTP